MDLFFIFKFKEYFTFPISNIKQFHVLYFFDAGSQLTERPTERSKSKGQLISKFLFGVIVWTKKPTKFFPGFLP